MKENIVLKYDPNTKIIGFLDEASGVFIVHPLESTCGRFEVDPEETYGIPSSLAEYIQHNNITHERI